jgi:hypothetical protein
MSGVPRRNKDLREYDTEQADNICLSIRGFMFDPPLPSGWFLLVMVDLIGRESTISQVGDAMMHRFWTNSSLDATCSVFSSL